MLQLGRYLPPASGKVRCCSYIDGLGVADGGVFLFGFRKNMKSFIIMIFLSLEADVYGGRVVI